MPLQPPRKLTPAQERRLKRAIAEEEAAIEDNRAMFREMSARMQRIDRIIDTLAEVRAARGLSGVEVARHMGVDRSLVSRLESAGTKHSPTLDTILAYADAIGVEVRIAVVDPKSGDMVAADAA